MLNAEISLQVDYCGDGKYALMIGESFAAEDTVHFDSVHDVFNWVLKKYGDTPVELSQAAHLILTIEMGVDPDADFSK